MKPKGDGPGTLPPRTLVLIPTELERRHLARQPDFGIDATCELCGFGPVAASARASHALAQHQPDRVVMVGIAGTLYPRGLPVATAAVFPSVVLDGVGVGGSSEFISAATLGFPHWPPTAADRQEHFDELPLKTPISPAAGQLLTCCAASASPEDAQQRREWFPGAVAEDMEGFGVALACQLAGVGLAIVRGISNEVGDRRMERWQISEALDAAWIIADDLIRRPSWDSQ